MEEEDRIDELECKLSTAWTTVDQLSQEYISMWARLEKLERLLFMQQNVISDLTTEGERVALQRLPQDAAQVLHDLDMDVESMHPEDIELILDDVGGRRRRSLSPLRCRTATSFRYRHHSLDRNYESLQDLHDRFDMNRDLEFNFRTTLSKAVEEEQQRREDFLIQRRRFLLSLLQETSEESRSRLPISSRRRLLSRNSLRRRSLPHHQEMLMSFIQDMRWSLEDEEDKLKRSQVMTSKDLLGPSPTTGMPSVVTPMSLLKSLSSSESEEPHMELKSSLVPSSPSVQFKSPRKKVLFEDDDHSACRHHRDDDDNDPCLLYEDVSDEQIHEMKHFPSLEDEEELNEGLLEEEGSSPEVSRETIHYLSPLLSHSSINESEDGSPSASNVDENVITSIAGQRRILAKCIPRPPAPSPIILSSNNNDDEDINSNRDDDYEEGRRLILSYQRHLETLSRLRSDYHQGYDDTRKDTREGRSIPGDDIPSRDVYDVIRCYDHERREPQIPEDHLLSSYSCKIGKSLAKESGSTRKRSEEASFQAEIAMRMKNEKTTQNERVSCDPIMTKAQQHHPRDDRHHRHPITTFIPDSRDPSSSSRIQGSWKEHDRQTFRGKETRQVLFDPLTKGSSTCEQQSYVHSCTSDVRPTLSRLSPLYRRIAMRDTKSPLNADEEAALLAALYPHEFSAPEHVYSSSPTSLMDQRTMMSKNKSMTTASRASKSPHQRDSSLEENRQEKRQQLDPLEQRITLQSKTSDFPYSASQIDSYIRLGALNSDLGQVKSEEREDFPFRSSILDDDNLKAASFVSLLDNKKISGVQDQYCPQYSPSIEDEEKQAELLWEQEIEAYKRTFGQRMTSTDSFDVTADLDFSTPDNSSLTITSGQQNTMRDDKLSTDVKKTKKKRLIDNKLLSVEGILCKQGSSGSFEDWKSFDSSALPSIPPEMPPLDQLHPELKSQLQSQQTIDDIEIEFDDEIDTEDGDRTLVEEEEGEDVYTDLEEEQQYYSPDEERDSNLGQQQTTSTPKTTTTESASGIKSSHKNIILSSPYFEEEAPSTTMHAVRHEKEEESLRRKIARLRKEEEELTRKEEENRILQQQDQSQASHYSSRHEFGSSSEKKGTDITSSSRLLDQSILFAEYSSKNTEDELRHDEEDKSTSIVRDRNNSSFSSGSSSGSLRRRERAIRRRKSIDLDLMMEEEVTQSEKRKKLEGETSSVPSVPSVPSGKIDFDRLPRESTTLDVHDLDESLRDSSLSPRLTEQEERNWRLVQELKEYHEKQRRLKGEGNYFEESTSGREPFVSHADHLPPSASREEGALLQNRKYSEGKPTSSILHEEKEREKTVAVDSQDDRHKKSTQEHHHHRVDHQRKQNQGSCILSQEQTAAQAFKEESEVEQISVCEANRRDDCRDDNELLLSNTGDHLRKRREHMEVVQQEIRRRRSQTRPQCKEPSDQLEQQLDLKETRRRSHEQREGVTSPSGRVIVDTRALLTKEDQSSCDESSKVCNESAIVTAITSSSIVVVEGQKRRSSVKEVPHPVCVTSKSSASSPVSSSPAVSSGITTVVASGKEENDNEEEEANLTLMSQQGIELRQQSEEASTSQNMITASLLQTSSSSSQSCQQQREESIVGGVSSGGSILSSLTSSVSKGYQSVFSLPGNQASTTSTTVIQQQQNYLQNQPQQQPLNTLSSSIGGFFGGLGLSGKVPNVSPFGLGSKPPQQRTHSLQQQQELQPKQLPVQQQSLPEFVVGEEGHEIQEPASDVTSLQVRRGHVDRQPSIYGSMGEVSCVTAGQTEVSEASSSMRLQQQDAQFLTTDSHRSVVTGKRGSRGELSSDVVSSDNFRREQSEEDPSYLSGCSTRQSSFLQSEYGSMESDAIVHPNAMIMTSTAERRLSSKENGVTTNSLVGDSGLGSTADEVTAAALAVQEKAETVVEEPSSSSNLSMGNLVGSCMTAITSSVSTSSSVMTPPETAKTPKGSTSTNESTATNSPRLASLGSFIQVFQSSVTSSSQLTNNNNNISAAAKEVTIEVPQTPSTPSANEGKFQNRFASIMKMKVEERRSNKSFSQDLSGQDSIDMSSSTVAVMQREHHDQIHHQKLRNRADTSVDVEGEALLDETAEDSDDHHHHKVHLEAGVSQDDQSSAVFSREGSFDPNDLSESSDKDRDSSSQKGKTLKWKAAAVVGLSYYSARCLLFY